MQAYFEGERNCSRDWILGVIDGDMPLANHMLLTRFSSYRQTGRFRDLQLSPIRQTVVLDCQCGGRYAIEFETLLGVNPGLHFFSCSECERRHVTPGKVVNASLWDESLGKWTAVAANISR
jgi:hypothetical protein